MANGIGLGAGLSGFAQGFASSFLTAKERKMQAQLEQQKTFREAMTKHILDPNFQGDPEDPALAETLGGLYGQENVPAIQRIVKANQAFVSKQPTMGQFLGTEPMPGAQPAAGADAAMMTPAAPAAQPETGTFTPGEGAAPAEEAAAKAKSPIERFQEKLPAGVTVPIKTREGTHITVAGKPAAAKKAEDEAAYWQNFSPTVAGLRDQFPTAEETTLEEMAHKVLVDDARAAGRAVPKEAAELARVSTRTKRKVEEVAATTRAKKETEAAIKEEEPIGTADAALWFDRQTGRPVSPETPLGEARKRAVKVTPAQVTTNTQLASATQFLRSWSGAADVLHKTDNPKKAAMNAARYAAGAATRGAFPKLAQKEMDAVASLEESKNNILSLLRTGMGEKGNIAARLVDKASKTGPQFFETHTTSLARRRFFAGMIAAVRAANGLPLPPEDRKFLASLRKDAEVIGIQPEEVDSALAAIRQAPGLEGAGATAPGGAADDPFSSLMNDYGLGGAQ